MYCVLIVDHGSLLSDGCLLCNCCCLLCAVSLSCFSCIVDGMLCDRALFRVCGVLCVVLGLRFMGYCGWFIVLFIWLMVDRVVLILCRG